MKKSLCYELLGLFGSNLFTSLLSKAISLAFVWALVLERSWNRILYDCLFALQSNLVFVFVSRDHYPSPQFLTDSHDFNFIKLQEAVL